MPLSLRPLAFALCLVLSPALAAQATPAQSAAFEPLHMPSPPYPPAEEKANHEGRVVLQVTIDTTGHVTEAAVAESSGWPALDAQAVTTARTWTFKLLRDAQGAPVGGTARIPVTFSLAEKRARAEALARAQAMTCRAFVDALAAQAQANPQAKADELPEYDALLADTGRKAMERFDMNQMVYLVRHREKLSATVLKQCTRKPDAMLPKVFAEGVAKLPKSF